MHEKHAETDPEVFPNLLAVIGSILHTHKVSIRPAIQICVLSTDVSIPSIARLALTAEHGVCEMTQVVAACVLIAVMASIKAGITRCAHLQIEQVKSPIYVKMFSVPI